MRISQVSRVNPDGGSSECCPRCYGASPLIERQGRQSKTRGARYPRQSLRLDNNGAEGVSGLAGKEQCRLTG